MVIDHHKFTDLFKLLQTTVDLIDPRLERGCNFTFGQRRLLLAKLPGDSLSLRYDQRRNERTSVPQKNRLADKWIVLQEKLDEAGINIRAVGAIENVFLPAGDKKTAICIDGAEVTGVKPAVGVDGLAGGFGVFKVARGYGGPAPVQFDIVRDW